MNVRAVAIVLLTLALLDDCTNEPVTKSDTPAPVETPAQPPQSLNPIERRLPAEPQILEGSGVAIWAKGYEGPLIAGLDGSVYDAYRPATVQLVQKALRERGLYGGPINGILDRPTMKSIFAFQEANNLQRCGVPTPHTRKMLEQGSHTDLSF